MVNRAATITRSTVTKLGMLALVARDEPRAERLYTLSQAAERLAFPSSDALRMYLARRPGLAAERHRRVGRSWVRLLSESELFRLRGLVIQEVVKH